MIEVTVSTQTKLEKSPYYYAVLHWIDPIEKDQYKWKTTKIRYVDESKKRLHNQAEQEANNKAEELRKAFEEELNSKIVEKKKSIVDDRAKQKFADYLRDWAEKQKSKKATTTSSTYSTNINGIIAPYFDKTNITLEELQTLDLQDFYDTQYKRVLTKGKNKGKLISKNTVNHYYHNINKALKEAVASNIIPRNPNINATIETPEEYNANYYEKEDCIKLLEKVKGTSLELIVNIATYYGLRRSEIIGLKWNAIDFTNNKIIIRHKVTEATIDSKRVLVKDNRLKTKKSYRSLPLINDVKNLLLKEKERQLKNKKIYGNAYKNKENYICVYDDGEIMKPDTITRKFSKFLVDNDMDKIRLHDLRHTCASLLLDNGVSMKEIQEWLGHSSYNTTANIYAHLYSNSKENSANTMSNVLNKRKNA